MANFNLYPSMYNAQALQTALGVSATCLQALNTTVQCEPYNAGRAAEGVDLDYWYQDNITSLCTSSCSTSLQSWVSSVESSCNGQTMTLNGAVVEPISIPVMYSSGYDLACLQDSSDNYCFFESQSWQGSDYIRQVHHLAAFRDAYAKTDFDSRARWDQYTCYHEVEANNPSVCNDTTWTPMNMTADMMATTNLYNSSLYCSECFLLLWRQRLLSPVLPTSDYSTYLVEQFELLQQNCSTTLSYSTSSSTLFISSASATAAATATSSTAAASTTCAGQVVPPVASGPPLACYALSEQYNVSTGTMMTITGDVFCGFNETQCFPGPCELQQIYSGTCENITSSLSNDTYNVTLPMFLSWNPALQGSCDALNVQQICVSSPGGTYKPPSSVIYAPTAAGSYFTTATPPSPTEPGAISACGLYYTVSVADTCNTIALRYGITFQDILSYNTELNSDCTNLWLNYAVCVAPITTGPLSTNGLCGPNNGYAICNGSQCCSTNGECGTGSAYCDASNCISGACTAQSEMISNNGLCNATTTCVGSVFGDCCSTSGYCGNSSAYCGPGNCSSGNCDPDIGGPSTNGECGPLFAGNKTCTGTQFGSCCSDSGYCGSSSDYCGVENCYSGACGGSSSVLTSTSTKAITSTSATSRKASTSTSVPAPSTVAVCPTYNSQAFKDDNGVTYTVKCGYSNNGKVIGSSTLTTNLPQCMDACDKQTGCTGALFQTGVNHCYLIGTLGSTAINSTYNLALLSASATTTSSVSCASATAVAVTFNELVTTSYGDSVYLVGSVTQLGSWDASEGIAMSASQYTSSNPLWSVTVAFAPGTSMEYKFVTIDASGDVTWEADPNHTLTVPTVCASAASVTETATWQS